jgi:hypothetical protein
VITRISKIKSIAVVVADKGYDSEVNHVMVREKLKRFSNILPRYEKYVLIWKTRGKDRKEMKRDYSKILYNQYNKVETIVSVIKRLFGEHISSKLIRMMILAILLAKILLYFWFGAGYCLIGYHYHFVNKRRSVFTYS